MQYQKLQPQLGQGGCAMIWKVRSLQDFEKIRSGQIVVAKIAMEGQLKHMSMKRELRILRIVKTDGCDNIINLLGTVSQNGSPTIFLEYCADGDLYKRVQNSCSGDFIWSILTQALKALMYLKKQGIMHRDLKAENFLFSGSLLKLSDFGLSAEINERPKDVQGTQSFLSPEGYLERTQSDKVDIWGLYLLILWLWDYETFSGIFIQKSSWNVEGTYSYYSQSVYNLPPRDLGRYDSILRKLLPCMGLGDQRYRFDIYQCVNMTMGIPVICPLITEENHDNIIAKASVNARLLWDIRRGVNGANPTQSMRNDKGFSIRNVSMTDRHPGSSIRYGPQSSLYPPRTSSSAGRQRPGNYPLPTADSGPYGSREYQDALAQATGQRSALFSDSVAPSSYPRQSYLQQQRNPSAASRPSLAPIRESGSADSGPYGSREYQDALAQATGQRSAPFSDSVAPSSYPRQSYLQQQRNPSAASRPSLAPIRESGSAYSGPYGSREYQDALAQATGQRSAPFSDSVAPSSYPRQSYL